MFESGFVVCCGLGVALFVGACGTVPPQSTTSVRRHARPPAAQTAAPRVVAPVVDTAGLAARADSAFPAPTGSPQIVAPGTMLVAYAAGDCSLFDEAGIDESETADPHETDFEHFFEVDTNAARLVMRVRAPGMLIGAWSDGTVLRVAHGVDDDPGRAEVVRVELATGVVSPAVTFDRASMYLDATPLFSRDAGELLWSRPLDYPGGGGGSYLDLTGRSEADAIEVELLPVFEQRGLHELSIGADSTSATTTRVTRQGLRDPRTVAVRPTWRGCANPVFAETPAGALAQIPFPGLPPPNVDTLDVLLPAAWWVPSPNVSGDIEVCVEGAVGAFSGPLRIRRPAGAWTELGADVDADKAWVTCTAQSCLALFYDASGWHLVRAPI